MKALINLNDGMSIECTDCTPIKAGELTLGWTVKIGEKEISLYIAQGWKLYHPKSLDNTRLDIPTYPVGTTVFIMYNNEIEKVTVQRVQISITTYQYSGDKTQETSRSEKYSLLGKNGYVIERDLSSIYPSKESLIEDLIKKI